VLISKPKIRILVVEDEMIIARTLQAQLTELGYEPVGHATDGAQAIAQALALRPDVVLMDVKLRGALDGITAALKILEQANIPSIFLTAYSSPDLLARAKQAAPLGYILKPFSKLDLSTTIEIGLHQWQNEKRFRSSEAALREISQGVIITDPEQNIQFVNRAFIKITGYSEADILGRNCKFLQGPDSDPKTVREIGIALAKHEDFAGEILNYRKNGTAFWNDLIISHQHNQQGGVSQIIGVTRDITERKQTSDRLLESEIRTRSIVAAAIDAVVAMDSQDQVTEWNHEAEKIFGWNKSEVMGRPVGELIIPQQHRAAHGGRLDHYLASRPLTDETGRTEINLVTRSGREFTAEVAITSFKIGQEVCSSAFLRDLTEKKNAEASRRLAEAQLTQSEKLKTLGTLVGGIAHEFNNMLAGVLGFVELASELTSKHPTTVDYLNEARGGVLRARDLVQRLLLFARPAPSGEPELIDLGALTTEVLPLIRASVRTEIAVNYDADTNVYLLRGDPSQIQQVLLSLCLNATRAITATKGVVTIAVSSQAFAASPDLALPLGNYVRLTVTDTGIGMDAATQARIFDPFFTATETNQGTGLGLAVVQSIVHAHAGFIRIHSQVGQGSQFEIFFPRATNEPSSPPTPTFANDAEPKPEATPRFTPIPASTPKPNPTLAAPPALPPAVSPEATSTAIEGASPTVTPRRVLLADDDDSIRSVVRMILFSEGYVVEECIDGTTAEQRFNADPAAFSLAVLDLAMPGINGGELAQKILKKNPSIQIVIMSGDHERPNVVITEKNLAIRRLMKPFSIKELLAAVS